MAIINSVTCGGQDDFSLNFNGNSPAVGDVWLGYNTNIDKRTGICVTITAATDESSSVWSAETQYGSCYDCFSNNYGVVSFRSCQEGINPIFAISGLSESFYNLLATSIGGTFYLEYNYFGTIIRGCYTLTKITSTNVKEFTGLIKSTLISGNTQTNCESCISGNSIIAEVRNCDNVTTHYVLMSSTSLLSHLISYTDGINEFCGTIVNYILVEEPLYTFVSDYGLKEKCDACLQNVGVKYNLVNCVDSEIIEVVWGSQLFVNGQVSNLSTNDGCFEVSGTTTEPVTTNLFLDFEPHVNCQSCIECSGVFYQYSLCGDVDNIIVGEILSYQVIPVNGVFWHPVQNDWCIRQTASNSASGLYDTFYSVLLAPSDCDSPTIAPVTWVAEECNDGFQVLIMTDDTISGSETIQAMWSTNNLYCVYITGPAIPASGDTFYNSALNGGGTTLVYGDCEACFDNTLVGVSSINCETLELTTYDVPYLTWGLLTNYGGNGNNPFNNLCFSDINGNCRTILECPQPLSGNLITPADSYFNCPTCRYFNPLEPPPISAGTEYTICVICEDCCQSGTTATTINPPHPVWTRPDGREVILLDAVQLGGMFGLNS